MTRATSGSALTDWPISDVARQSYRRALSMALRVVLSGMPRRKPANGGSYYTDNGDYSRNLIRGAVERDPIRSRLPSPNRGSSRPKHVLGGCTRAQSPISARVRSDKIDRPLAFLMRCGTTYEGTEMHTRATDKATESKRFFANLTSARNRGACLAAATQHRQVIRCVGRRDRRLSGSTGPVPLRKRISPSE
jgi:hypothetical protein